MNKAKQLLKELTKVMPPGVNQNHNLTLSNDNLVLTLMFETEYIPIEFVDESDFQRNIEDIITDIIKMFPEKIKDAKSVEDSS